MLAPSPWETSLQSNAVSHWLGANLESAFMYSKLCLNYNKSRRSQFQRHVTTGSLQSLFGLFLCLWFHELIAIMEANPKVRRGKIKNIKCKQNDLNKLHQWIDANTHLKEIIEIGQMLKYANDNSWFKNYTTANN